MRNYICHARGAFNVLHALGPSNIVSEGEKDLLIAQAEVMVRAAFGQSQYDLLTWLDLGSDFCRCRLFPEHSRMANRT